MVPTYDEAKNVQPLATRLLQAVPDVDILFVDDASPDGTAERVAALGRQDARIRLLLRHEKLGLGTAYLAGFEYGLTEKYDRIVTLDADLSHDPAYLPALLDASENADLVIGSRYVAGGGIRDWGLHRRLLSRYANLLARGVLRLPVRDVTSGFRVYRASTLTALPLASIRSSGYSFLEEIVFLADRLSLTIAEVPIVFCDREGGRSKISATEVFKAAFLLLRLGLRPHPASELGEEHLLAGADSTEP